jgi:hypothetical protein
MSPKDRTIIARVEPDVAEQMDAIQERFGMALSEQVRRALDAWLASGAGGLVDKQPAPRKRRGRTA